MCTFRMKQEREVLYMKKNKVKTLKIVIIILVILAIIIGITIYKNIENEKKNEITLDNLPKLDYTEDQAKEFYSKKLIKYLSTFQNDFHFKYTAEGVNEDGTEGTVKEEYSKKGNLVSIYYADSNQRIVIDNEYIYHYEEDNYIVYRLKNEKNINTNADVLLYSLDSINKLFVKTGNEIINNEKYYFEEYKMEKDNTILVRYYFDSDDNIKYIKAYKENSKFQTFFTVEMLENRTYDFMFDMSDRYYKANW